MLEQGLLEALSVFRVRERRVEGRARHADRLRSDADATALEVGQRNLVAHALITDQVRRRYPAVFEHDLRGVGRGLAELVLDARDGVARRIGRHPERADAALARALVGDGHDDADIGVLAAGDELLDAVEHVMVAVAPRGGAQRRRVAARLRLGQRKRTEHAAGSQRLEPLFFLRVVRIGHAYAAHRAIVDRDDGRGAAIAGRDFLDHDRQREIVEAGAAELFRHRDAEHAELRELLQRFAREAALAVPCGGVRSELLLREVAQRVADHLVLVGQDHSVHWVRLKVTGSRPAPG